MEFSPSYSLYNPFTMPPTPAGGIVEEGSFCISFGSPKSVSDFLLSDTHLPNRQNFATTSALSILLTQTKQFFPIAFLNHVHLFDAEAQEWKRETIKDVLNFEQLSTKKSLTFLLADHLQVIGLRRRLMIDGLVQNISQLGDFLFKFVLSFLLCVFWLTFYDSWQGIFSCQLHFKFLVCHFKWTSFSRPWMFDLWSILWWHFTDVYTITIRTKERHWRRLSQQYESSDWETGADVSAATMARASRLTGLLYLFVSVNTSSENWIESHRGINRMKDRPEHKTNPLKATDWPTLRWINRHSFFRLFYLRII